MTTKLVFIKRINTKKDSIFYSFINYNNQIYGFGRDRYDNREIICCKVNDFFEIIEEKKIKGEDPRCFIHNKNLYVLDNYLNDNHLYDYHNDKYIKINIDGKNLSFLSNDNKLYIIHYIKPLKLYIFDIHTGNLTEVEVNNNDIYDYKGQFRGGTPGYYYDNNKYYGYGHIIYLKKTLYTLRINKLTCR